MSARVSFSASVLVLACVSAGLAAPLASCTDEASPVAAGGASVGSAGNAGASGSATTGGGSGTAALEAGAGGSSSGGQSGEAGAAGSSGATTCEPPLGLVDLAGAKALAPTLDKLCVVAPGGDGTVTPLGRTLPYDLVSPLFSDYLLKTRTVWLPEGQAATYEPEKVLAFPTGTIITKTFAYAEDLRAPTQKRHLVETRVLIKTPDEWLSLPYLWDDKGEVATLSVGGTIKPLSFLREDGSPLSLNYLVPNKNQCIKCHEDLAKTELIGPKARNLNRDFAYASGTENQLTKWTSLGLLVGAPAPSEAPRLAAWDDPNETTERRARSWLEINCAHCHNERGAGRTSGLYLWASVPESSSTLGICKPPVAAGGGAGTLTYDIVPGQPDASILMYRMRSTDPAVMMPELGRSVVHEAGVDLVGQWISGLAGSCSTMP